MKPLVLRLASIFLSLKNELKIFLFMQTYEKDRSALKGLLLQTPTLLEEDLYQPIFLQYCMEYCVNSTAIILFKKYFNP